MSAPTTERLLPGIVSRCTEFVYDAKEQRTLTGDCGPDALAEGVAWADQVLCTAAYVAATYDQMRLNSECDPNGPSTISGLEHAALRMQLPGVERLGFADPLPGWEAWYLDRVGIKALVTEVANGQALNDYLTKLGENAAHLQYHYILLVGYHPGGMSARTQRVLPAGWWAADGDNYAFGDILQFYPVDILAAARPCAALAFGGRVAPKRTPMETGFYGLTTTNDPQVWACAQYTTTLGHGFLGHYRTLSAANGSTATQILGLPISNEYPQGARTRQDFERGYLIYDQTLVDPWMISHGLAGLDLRSATKQITTLEAALKSAQDAQAQANKNAETAQLALAKAQADLQAAQQAAAAAAAAPSDRAALLASCQALAPAVAGAEQGLAALSTPGESVLAILGALTALPAEVDPLVRAARSLVDATAHMS